jgi:hypothetical protein
LKNKIDIVTMGIIKKGFNIMKDNRETLSNILSDIYRIFSKYPKPTQITCFDGTKDECDQILIQVNREELRFLNKDLIDSLEFYGVDDEWGTVHEIKYLLPRILELITENFQSYVDNYNHSFFKYKIKNNKLYNSKEIEIIDKYVKYLCIEYSLNNDSINNLIILLIDSGYDADFIKQFWKEVPEKILRIQFNNFLVCRYNYNFIEKTYSSKNTSLFSDYEHCQWLSDLSKWIVDEIHNRNWYDGDLIDYLFLDNR